MTVQTGNKVKLIYGVLFSLLSLTVAALFIAQVCDIYFSAGGAQSPYTVENIVAHFQVIAVPLYIWLGMIVGGLILWLCLPAASPKKGKNDLHYVYHRMRKNFDRAEQDENNASAIAEVKQYEKIKWIIRLSCAAVCIVCASFCLGYLFNPSNFPNAEQNQEVASAAIFMSPFIVTAFLLCIGVFFFERWLINKQMPLMKGVVATSKRGVPAQSSNKLVNAYYRAKAFFERNKSVWIARLVVALAGVSLLIAGIALQGYESVLAKAIAICKQCIGLG